MLRTINVVFLYNNICGRTNYIIKLKNIVLVHERTRPDFIQLTLYQASHSLLVYIRSVTMTSFSETWQ